MHNTHARTVRLQAIRAIAAGQDSQFATAQALEVGLTYRALQRMRDSGHIQQLRFGVWRFTSAAGDPDPGITAFLACWPHGVISHASAAQQHRFKRVAAPEVPHVTVEAGVNCHPRGVAVHHTRTLERRDIVTVGTVRYTGRARTVCDLSDHDDPWESLSLVDDAVAAGVRVTWLHTTAVRLQSGRPGARLVARATRPEAAGEFRSWLERAAAHIYRIAGLPEPEWNVPIRDEAGLIGRADALWRLLRVISEKEGLRYHTKPAARRRDAKRFNRFSDAGYIPRRFSWEDVVHTPVDMASTLLRALNSAGADLDPLRIPRQITLPDRPFL